MADLVILGIDPGIATIGFGAINSAKGTNSMLRCGVITTPPHQPLSKRLAQIYSDALELIDSIKPDAISIEELFFNTNVTTGISVAHGRGVLILAGENRNIPMFEYTPLQVKQAVTGYGRAEKRQVMDMTRCLLNLKSIPRPDDAADALALALCHARTALSPLSGLGGSECSTI